MRGKALVGAAIALVLAGGPAATAKDLNGSFAVKGVGVLDCGAYIRAANSGDAELAQYAGYLSGYISAFNEVTPNTFDLLPWQQVDTVMLLMLQRCRQAPETNFGAAVSEMARFFDAQKLSRMAERVTVGTGVGALELYVPVVAQVEAALARWGYPTEDLETSLARFREEHGIVAEKEAGQLTLLKLLYGVPPGEPTDPAVGGPG